MKLNLDDPRLTAYALNELDPAGRAAVETELRDSPACREAVEEIRRAAGFLSGELAAEPCPALLPKQRDTIDAKLEPSNVVPFPARGWFGTVGLAALAASVMFAIVWQVWFSGSGKQVQQMARLDAAKTKLETTPALTPALSPRRGGQDAAAPTVAAPTAPATPPVLKDERGGKATPDVTVVSVPPAEPVRRETLAVTNAAPRTPPPVQRDSASAPTTGDATKMSGDEFAKLVERNRAKIQASSTPAQAPTQQQSINNNVIVAPPDAQPKLAAPQSTLAWDVAKNQPQPVNDQLSGKDASKAGEFRSVLSAPATPAPQSQAQPVPTHRFVFSENSNGAVPPAGTPQPQTTATPSSGILALDSVVPTPAGRGGAGGGGAIAGGGGGARGGRGRAVAGSANFGLSGGTVQMTRNSVVVTESKTTTTTVYDGDPVRDNFTQWRYYRYPTPLPPTTASYPQYPENQFQPVMEHPLSTFSADVDTASYANVRRFLNAGQLPPRDAVRLEELVNYFTYHYAPPKGEDPFAASIEVAGCPWDTEHRLVRIGLKGREVARDKRPPSNFVFLIDVSGSMGTSERLPLIKQALRQLVKKMGEGDRVAIVVYASEAGVKLASTPCTDKERILEVIDSLTAGGSTNGGDGIQQAYRVAEENFIKGGVNRVLLCTDGDFNVGMTDQNQLVRMVQERAKSGVFLTTLGVGTDNYKDALMQKLADKGNGNYYYLDSLEEAQKVLIDQMSGTLVTIAKDVKIQVEFNPAQVQAYRLIGYEKRVMRNEDFNNDAKDAGEIGAGHTVTALYEVVPAGREFRSYTDGLKYQGTTDAAPQADHVIPAHNKEMLTLKLRYKHPDGVQSRLLEFPVTDGGATYGRASQDFKFAAAVVSFGMLLRDSQNQGSANYATVLELAQESKGADEGGYRSEFINLVKKAQAMQGYPYNR